MAGDSVRVRFSVSTWQQPVPESASVERDALVQAIAERVLSLGKGRLLVGVDGYTASGKTSFGHELATHISRTGRQVLRASLDDFKKPWRDRHLYDRESGDGYYRNAFDYAAVQRLLLQPCQSGTSQVVLCSIDPLTQVDHSSTFTEASTDAVLIVDGVFAFRPAINDYWDLRIWLDVTPEISVQRGGARDESWAGSEAEAVHRDRYGGAQSIYLRGSRSDTTGRRRRRKLRLRPSQVAARLNEQEIKRE